MRISFDLDDTLILYEDHNPEPNRVPWFMRIFYNERLRTGTPELLKKLLHDGWEVYIYTTSNRSVGYIRSLFKFYGIKIAEVINQAIHEKAFRGKRGHEIPSKYPSRWKIDLHIDDCKVLEANAERYGFRMLRVDPEDHQWASLVYYEASKVQEKLNGD